jgi:hypothetical protein
MRLLAALLALALLVALPAAAQEHQHAASGPVFLAHDLRTTGEAYAGGLAGFAPLFLGDDHLPDPHKQNQVRVSQGGVTLFETTADSGHDYDGVAPLLIALPAAGPYEVASLSGDKVQASFAGVAAPAPAGPPVAVDLTMPVQASAGVPAPIVITAKGPSGKPVPHSDGIVEVRRDGPSGELLLRTHLHTHEDPMRLEYVFPAPGTYAVRATVYQAYPGGGEGDFAPATTVRTLTVAAGLPVPGVPAVGVPPAARNAAVEGAAGGTYRLVGTYDPYTHVGLGTLQHLAATVMDPAARAPVAHVDFTAELSGPAGTWWSSASLHEYDGILQVAARAPLPGLHVLKVTASAGSWKDTLEMPFHVEPAADLVPEAATLALQAPRIEAGQPAAFTLSARDAAGRPLAHSEVDLLVLDPDGVTYLVAKLHTHASGDFPFTLALPRAGTYEFVATASSLEPSTPAAGAASFKLGVEPGVAVAAPTVPPAAATAPMPALVAAVALLGAAWAGSRRRTAGHS